MGLHDHDESRTCASWLQVSVTDVYGDGRHVSISVVSNLFEGKNPVQRQRMVYKVGAGYCKGTVGSGGSKLHAGPQAGEKEGLTSLQRLWRLPILRLCQGLCLGPRPCSTSPHGDPSRTLTLMQHGCLSAGHLA